MSDFSALLGISDRAPFLCVCIIASCTRNRRRTKAEPPAFFKIALSVIRALCDELLICACRLFQLGNAFKARIELNSESALRWNRKT
jgi:hypothetical protein